MAKKKTTKKKASFNEVLGTPTALLLPARNYKFKVYDEDFSITIPRKGKYVDLDKKTFSKEDGEFDFLQKSDDGKEQVVYFPAISKVMFGTGQYPDLEDAQAFAPMAFVIREDEVEIIGSKIEMVREN